MKYYLLGKNISTSYSKFIHNQMNNFDYELKNIDEEFIIDFINKKEYDGLNITYPYKNKVIDYLDYKDDIVIKSNVCNTIINKNNKLYGYNTDYSGFLALLKFYKIKVKNKKVLILGNKATARSVSLALNKNKCFNIKMLSHQECSKVNEYINDYDIIINTTPINSNITIENNNDNLIAIDVNFNKHRTDIFKNIKHYYNGLYMLVYQAYVAEVLFNNINYSLKEINNIYYKTLLEYTNLIFIGLPYSGKSYIGNKLANSLNKEIIDTDKIIENKLNDSISNIINIKGIEFFRNKENELINQLKDNKGNIISCGGGIILNKDNIDLLNENGIIIYLKRNLNKAIIDNTRPLIKNKKDLNNLYINRNKLYNKYAVIKVNNNFNYKITIKNILKKVRCI